jgi:hypothetical protein
MKRHLRYDFNTGGKAFAGMIFVAVRMTRSKVTKGEGGGRGEIGVRDKRW